MIEDCELRDGAPSTKHPQIISRHPDLDRDAIADCFFKKSTKSKQPTFNNACARKATPIALFITEQHFHAVLCHIEQAEMANPSTVEIQSLVFIMCLHIRSCQTHLQ
jgi:hypothetical protein